MQCPRTAGHRLVGLRAHCKCRNWEGVFTSVYRDMLGSCYALGLSNQQLQPRTLVGVSAFLAPVFWSVFIVCRKVSICDWLDPFLSPSFIPDAGGGRGPPPQHPQLEGL